VFVASDLTAQGVLAALEKAGRRVPEDVAVGGFDHSPAALASRPELTTIRQPWDRISAAGRASQPASTSSAWSTSDGVL
jgi:DNA-binding LacI/PurR family transcriptional regulator